MKGEPTFQSSPAAYVKNQLIRAFCDTSMKIGTHIEWTMAIVLRNRAITDFARGCHGNQFDNYIIGQYMQDSGATVSAIHFHHIPSRRVENCASYGALFIVLIPFV